MKLKEVIDKVGNCKQFFCKIDDSVILFIVVLIGASPLCLYFAMLHQLPISYDAERWGQFGDFIGGVMNPFIGMVSLWLILRSLDAVKVSKKNSEAFAIQFCLDVLNKKSNIEKIQTFDGLLRKYHNTQMHIEFSELEEDNKIIVAYLVSLRAAIASVVEAQGLVYGEGALKVIWSRELGILDAALRLKEEGSISP
jgi:hypothetical protein